MSELKFDAAGAIERLKSQVDTGLKQTAADFVAAAKELAPEDTGVLKDNIVHDEGVAVEAGRRTITVRSKVLYSYWQEFGTSFFAAHPFMLPARAEVRDKLRSNIKGQR